MNHLLMDQIADVLLENDCIVDRENVFDHYPLLLVSYEELNSHIVPLANLDTIDVECPYHSWTSTMHANDETLNPCALLWLGGTIKTNQLFFNRTQYPRQR